MLMAPNGHFLGQIPQPMQRFSEMKAIFDSGVTSIQRRPLRTTGQDFLHSCLHFCECMIRNLQKVLRRLGAYIYLWLALFEWWIMSVIFIWRGMWWGKAQRKICRTLSVLMIAILEAGESANCSSVDVKYRRDASYIAQATLQVGFHTG